MKGILRSFRTAFITTAFLYLLSWVVNYITTDPIEVYEKPVDTSVEAIFTKPVEYYQSLVKINGSVVFTMKLPVPCYIINDGTGYIMVYPKSGQKDLPGIGEKKLIVGKIKQTGVAGPLHLIALEEV